MNNFEVIEDQETWVYELASVAEDLQGEIIAMRQYLHAHPELSMREFETTRFIVDRVAALGLTAVPTDQEIGATCDWQSSGLPVESSNKASAQLVDGASDVRPAKRIGLRGDIDALPIVTSSVTPYASRLAGVMHACGHDAHASMVWGALAMLQRLDKLGQLPWPVAIRAIFQPAEETSEGGPLMVLSGALENVDCVLALHVDPTMPVGKVSGRPGALTAACDSFEIEIVGRSGHSARPHLSVDAIAAGASWVSEMYARVPRVHDCRDPAVVSVGTFNAGSAPNIVAGKATLSGTIRTFSESARAAIMQEMRNVAEATQMTFGCQVKVVFSAFTPAVQNDPELCQSMMNVAARLPDIAEVGTIALPSMGAEDFAFFGQHRRVCMMRLGIAGEKYGMHALHTPAFDIDERALSIGAQLLAASVIELSSPSSCTSGTERDTSSAR